MLPAATRRGSRVAESEWGEGLIRSWNTAGWITLSHRIADKIARLIGAGPGEVMVGDSTSVNLFKLLNAAIANFGRPGKSRDHEVTTSPILRSAQLPNRSLYRHTIARDRA